MLPEAVVQTFDKVVLVAVLYNSCEVITKKPNTRAIITIIKTWPPVKYTK